MIRSVLCLALLLAFHVYGFADEELSQLVSGILAGIPGKSAVWAETFRPYYGEVEKDPFFSPAIVRVGDSEECRIVPSSACLIDSNANSISYFFTALSPADTLSLKVIPASGVNVTYQLNVPAQFPSNVVQDKLQSADLMIGEYSRLESLNHGVPTISFLLVSGLLYGAGFVWIVTNGPGPFSQLEAVGIGALFGLAAPASLWLAIDYILSDISNGRRMQEIRQDLRTFWQ